jgi:hypothetical protein
MISTMQQQDSRRYPYYIVSTSTRLEQDAHKLLEPRIRLVRELILRLHVIELASAGRKVDIHKLDRVRALDDLPADIADDKDGEGDVGCEKVGDVPVAGEEDCETVELGRVSGVRTRGEASLTMMMRKKKTAPNQERYGWKGALYGKSSRVKPCAFNP